jgi:hypothetical protein
MNPFFFFFFFFLLVAAVIVAADGDPSTLARSPSYQVILVGRTTLSH